MRELVCVREKRWRVATAAGSGSGCMGSSMGSEHGPAGRTEIMLRLGRLILGSIVMRVSPARKACSSELTAACDIARRPCSSGAKDRSQPKSGLLRTVQYAVYGTRLAKNGFFFCHLVFNITNVFCAKKRVGHACICPRMITG